MDLIFVFILILLVTFVIDGIFNGMGLFMNLCMLAIKLVSNIIGVLIAICLISYCIF